MSEPVQTPVCSFFDRPNVHLEQVPVGPGIPLGIETVSNAAVGLGGAYGTWGDCYDNDALPALLEDRLGCPLLDKERLNLSELGFVARHHIPRLTPEQHLALEERVGSRFLVEAAHASGWDPGEVEAVLIGCTFPITDDFTERIARAAGVPDSALKVSVHKACDGSVAGLNLALNRDAPASPSLGYNLAELLYGKKVLVGGIEGLSRVLSSSSDRQAMQLFGTGAGVIGIIPGQNMNYLVGSAREVYDEEGLLQVHMAYPHSRHKDAGGSLVEVASVGQNHLRVAGLMHEPEDAAMPVVMAGPMGMVKLFVRSGVEAVRGVVQAYRQRVGELSEPGHEVAIGIVHHANLKINQLKARYLQKEGINIPMPWLLSEFGNVSAASNMIAFLRALAGLKPGDRVLFDGFGAGTYYDVLAVELGKAP